MIKIQISEHSLLSKFGIMWPESDNQNVNTMVNSYVLLFWLTFTQSTIFYLILTVCFSPNHLKQLQNLNRKESAKSFYLLLKFHLFSYTFSIWHRTELTLCAQYYTIVCVISGNVIKR